MISLSRSKIEVYGQMVGDLEWMTKTVMTNWCNMLVSLARFTVN